MRALLGSLQARLLGLALLPVLVSSLLFAVYDIHTTVLSAEARLVQQGRDMVGQLAEVAAFDLFSGNIATLRTLIDHARTTQNAAAIGLSDAQGRWWLTSGRNELLDRQALTRAMPEWNQGGYLYFSRPVGMNQASSADPYLEGVLGLNALGRVVVVMDPERVTMARNDSLRTLSLFLFPLLALTVALAWWSSRRIGGPLHAITQVVRNLAAGHLLARTVPQASGEVGQLEVDVNEMADALQAGHERLEQGIAEATAELRQQKLAAEAAVGAKSKFLAAASHDLRQPLHALTLLASALKDKAPPSGEMRRLAEHIDASAAAMGSMLNGLLDLSRLEAGVVEVRPVCFPIQRIFDVISRHFTPAAAEKGLLLHVHTSQLAVNTDPLLLERILMNLVSNAIRYTAAGRVVVGLRRSGEQIRIQVLDTGVGIPAAFQERIFDEYFQLDNPERHRAKGLGLGLTIVAREAELLGCKVEVRSTPGRGSCFCLTLPVCTVSVDDSAEASNSVDTMDRPLIAMIDDDEIILGAMATLLEEWGMEVAPATGVEELLTDLRVLGRNPDAILSDYRLPGPRDGIAVIAYLREVLGAHIPAAVITGDTGPESIELINASGLTLLHKPLKPARLRAYLNHALSQSVQRIIRPRP